MVRMIPTQLVFLKLSWDSEVPTSSDHFRKETKVYWGDIQWIGWVEDGLEAFCCQEIFDRGGSVDLVHRPKTETSPVMTIQAFLA
jgi:hypothetical protein